MKLPSLLLRPLSAVIPTLLDNLSTSCLSSTMISKLAFVSGLLGWVCRATQHFRMNMLSRASVLTECSLRKMCKINVSTGSSMIQMGQQCCLRMKCLPLAFHDVFSPSPRVFICTSEGSFSAKFTASQPEFPSHLSFFYLKPFPHASGA